MAGSSFAQTSFLGGLWSKSAQGRFDRPDYRTALNVCRNAMPLEQGAWTRRPGTQFAHTTRGGGPGRVETFDFRQSEPYYLEFTSGMIRFRAGATLATTNDDVAVLSLSTDKPAIVRTATPHGWSTNNTVQFAKLFNQSPLLQNRLFLITVIDTTHFSIVDSVTGQPVDGSLLGAFATFPTVQRIQEVGTPYFGTLWKDLRMIQTGLTAILLHAEVQPFILTATAPGPGQVFFSFALAAATLVDGPYLDVPTNGALLTPSAINGNITVLVSAQNYSATTSYKVGDFVTSASLTYQSLVDQNEGNTPATSPSAWAPVSAGLMVGPSGFVGTDVGRYLRIQDAAQNWTWGKITGLQTLISATLAGSTAMGTMTLNAGVAAAFDSFTSKLATFCAANTEAGNPTNNVFVGKNYSLASAQQIQHATIWPSRDLGMVSATKAYNTVTTSFQGVPSGIQLTGTTTQLFTVPTAVGQVLVNLWGNHTAPAFSSGGVLLGSAVWTGGPLSITSNDQVTAWEYVWFEIIASGVDLSVPPDLDTRPTPVHVGDTFIHQTSSLSTFSVSTYVAQAQFFAPPTASSSGNAISVQILGAPLADTTPRTVWRLGAYSNTTGWPSCGTYHEGRLWLAGAIDNRLDGSVSNQTLNFAPTVATGGAVTDASAIAAVFNAPDVNSIFWMVPDQLGIIVGTQAGDWLVQASALNSPLTPTSMQAHRYDRLGCANIEPRRASGPLIAVHRFRRKVLEYFADVFSGRIGAQNLTWQAQTATAPGVAQIAYQNELAPIVWARCDDGSLFGITYKRENLMSSQPPTFAGMHQHTLGSGRTVESLAAGPSPDGLTDTLCMVTTNTAGERHVEIMTPMFQENDAIANAWFLDDAVRPTSTVVANAGFTINGLWHVNNRNVTVFAGGLDCGDWLVTNGSITMTYGDGISEGTGGGLFTQAFVSSFGGGTFNSGMPVVVGFTYNSDGQIVRPMSPQDSGARNGPALGKKRRAQQFAALLVNAVGGAKPEVGTAAGLQFGTDFARLFPALLRTADDITALPYGTPFSGVFQTTLADDPGFDGMLCWRQGRPWPTTVAAVEMFLQTQDK